MECEENGRNCHSPARNARGVKRKRRVDDAGDLRLLIADTVPGPSVSKPMHNDLLQLSRMEATDACFKPSTSNPFMNDMDEISYWVTTKRAPCLYDYDKLMKKQNDGGQYSKDISTYSCPTENDVVEKVPPKKKKKNIKGLDDESVSSQKQQNIYFETPQHQKTKNVLNNCKSVSPGSDIDFNIKITPKPKAKKPKLQKNTKATLNKRNKMVTSTPKVETQNLRRSSRLNKSVNNNNGQLNASLDIVNDGFVNGTNRELSVINNKCDDLNRLNSIGDKERTHLVKKDEKKDTMQNGEYEDYSDVSGFTANYIRSTKIQTKTPQKVRRKINRNLMQTTQQNVDPDASQIVMCVNKSMNTGEQNSGVLNHSSDSSQNVINLVTVSGGDKSKKTDRATSLIKFVDSRCAKSSAKKKVNGNLINDSFQSGSSIASRYPKRLNSKKQNDAPEEKLNDRKENSHEKFVYRTRSRKRIKDSCARNISNDESSNVINVATVELNKKNNAHCEDQNGQETLSCSRDTSNRNDSRTNVPAKFIGRVKTSLDKTKQSLKKDSTRDRSGFAACFSDSDSDTEPLKARKFFS